MTGLHDVQGYFSSVPGTATASARLGGQINPRLSKRRSARSADRTSKHDTRFTNGAGWQLTTMNNPTNIVYVKKSPGCENRDDSRSRPLPYWYTVASQLQLCNGGGRCAYKSMDPAG
jgi:hypothetical protein